MMASPVFDRLAALADPTRCRVLLALERQELAVNELKAVLQLPQSTVSRHLKVLGDEGWLTSRAHGTSNWYRMAGRELEPSARRLWQVVRDDLAESPGARRDAERLKSVLADRHSKSQEFFATSAGQWDRLRLELFGSGVEWFGLAGLLDSSWVVADLGTGTGLLAAGIAPHVERVIAVDESPAMLAAAAKRVGPAGNVDLRRATLEALPLDDRSVDLAIIMLVLHHLAEPGRAIEEAGRILKPGGRLIVVDMMPHERAEYRETMGHLWLGFDRETMAAWCRHGGLLDPSYRALPSVPRVSGPLLFLAATTKTA